jgi:hypothetical protein
MHATGGCLSLHIIMIIFSYALTDDTFPKFHNEPQEFINGFHPEERKMPMIFEMLLDEEVDSVVYKKKKGN